MKKCEGFAWIGQGICHCENCGRSMWEHEFDRAPGVGPFHKQSRKRMDLSSRLVQQLRWRYTMLVDPRYCPHHKPEEYVGIDQDEIIVWLDKLKEWRGERALA